ncbi:MAG: DUF2130 domain-containing protein [Pseudomonadota bacterium]|nr:DUF2130 domain-containing protein [Pseudomonadota bacterium]
MKSVKATCPECSHQFPLDEILTKEIDSMVSKETKEIVEKRDAEIRSMKSQFVEMESQNKIKAQQLAHEEVKKALKAQEQQIKAENKMILIALDEEIKDAKTRLQEAQKNELSLRKKALEVEQREKEIDLEIARKTSEQVTVVREKLTKQIAEDFHRKDTEREHLISELRKQLVEMKQKAEQGSQQIHGELFEDEIGALLREAFPTDTIEDVPKGVCGGDLIQAVVTRSGQRAGRILWEVKQTKSFQTAWLEKLRDDRNELGAELAILVTATMPKGKVGAYLDQGIWVVDPIVAISVAQVARQSLIDVHQAVVVSSARHEKADILYNYLTNPVFRQRLEAVVESFHQMREDLEREKRAISKSWKQRERQIDSVVENTVHIYSDIQSVVGHKVLTIQRLELPTSEVTQHE